MKEKVGHVIIYVFLRIKGYMPCYMGNSVQCHTCERQLLSFSAGAIGGARSWSSSMERMRCVEFLSQNLAKIRPSFVQKECTFFARLLVKSSWTIDCVHFVRYTVIISTVKHILLQLSFLEINQVLDFPVFKTEYNLCAAVRLGLSYRAWIDNVIFRQVLVELFFANGDNHITCTFTRFWCRGVVTT